MWVSARSAIGGDARWSSSWRSNSSSETVGPLSLSKVGTATSRIHLQIVSGWRPGRADSHGRRSGSRPASTGFLELAHGRAALHGLEIRFPVATKLERACP